MSCAKGGSFSPQSLHQLFTNPYYAGILVDPWSGDEFAGQHTPMVTRRKNSPEVATGYVAKRNRLRPPTKRTNQTHFRCGGLVRCDTLDCSDWPPFRRAERADTRITSATVLPAKSTVGVIGQPTSMTNSRHSSMTSRRRGHVMEVVEERIIRMLDQETHRKVSERKTAAEALGTTPRRTSATNPDASPGLNHRPGILTREEKTFFNHAACLDYHSGSVGEGADGDARGPPLRLALDALMIALGSTWNSLQQPFRRRFERLILPVGSAAHGFEPGGSWASVQAFSRICGLGIHRGCPTDAYLRTSSLRKYGNSVKSFVSCHATFLLWSGR